MNIRPMSCCGVKELDGMAYFDTPQAAFIDFANQIYEPNSATNCRFRYVVFTEASLVDVKPEHLAHYGVDFEAYILKHTLGTVLKTTPNLNPNSGRNVIVYVWTLDHGQCRKHLKELSKEVRKVRVAKTKTKIASLKGEGASLWATLPPPSTTGFAQVASNTSTAPQRG